jgi:hypothetical protein
MAKLIDANHIDYGYLFHQCLDARKFQRWVPECRPKRAKEISEGIIGEMIAYLDLMNGPERLSKALRRNDLRYVRDYAFDRLEERGDKC